MTIYLKVSEFQKQNIFFSIFPKKKNEKFYPNSENTSIVHVVSERPPMPISFQKRAFVLSCKSAKSQQGTFNFKTFFPLFSLSLQFFVWCYVVKKLWLQKYTVLRFILIFVWSCVFWTFWLMISIMFFKERTSSCGGHNLPPPKWNRVNQGLLYLDGRNSQKYLRQT